MKHKNLLNFDIVLRSFGDIIFAANHFAADAFILSYFTKKATVDLGSEVQGLQIPLSHGFHCWNRQIQGGVFSVSSFCKDRQIQGGIS